MKAILSFDLTDFEDQIELRRCMYSLDMGIALWEMQNNILREYHKQELTGEQLAEKIQSVLNDLPFNIDDLIR